jgi:hypothetical protein
VHLSEAALAARSGIARVEDLGPATLELVRDWLGRPELGLTLTPVLDLDDRAAVDAYQTPDRIRETVLPRQPCCPFPWCATLSRRKDMDHITPYRPPDQGGPPGQTAAHLLGSPCRRHTATRPPAAGPTRCPNPASTCGAHHSPTATWSSTPAPPPSTTSPTSHGPGQLTHRPWPPALPHPPKGALPRPLPDVRQRRGTPKQFQWGRSTNRGCAGAAVPLA